MEHVDMLEGLNQNINDQAFPIRIKHSVTIDYNFMKFVLTHRKRKLLSFMFKFVHILSKIITFIGKYTSLLSSSRVCHA